MSWAVISDWLSWGCFGLGALFILIGALGILRFPDFYTRIHASGLTDTLGAELVILGMVLQSDSWLLVAKLFFIALFLLFTGPAATHAVAHAAWVSGLNPLSGKDLKHAEIAPCEEAPKGRV